MLNKFLVITLTLFSACLIHALGFSTETHFIFIRHGQTDWNIDHRLQGYTDIPLNSKGIEQANLVAEQMVIHHPDICPIIYASDLQRASFTAQTIANSYLKTEKRLQLETSPNFREVSWGILEGVKTSDADKKYKDYISQLAIDFPLRKERWNYPMYPEDVETLNHVVERVMVQLKEVAAKHPGEKVVIVAHGRLITTMRIHAQNLETDILPSIPNCALAHFTYDLEKDEQPLTFIKTEVLGK